MQISEVFRSFQGEGFLVGTPAIFVRVAGCNYSCSFCDTRYALGVNAGHSMEVDRLVREVESLVIEDASILVLSGGEPLCQYKELAEFLFELKKVWNPHLLVWETNGAFLCDKEKKSEVAEVLKVFDCGPNDGDHNGQMFVVSPKPDQMEQSDPYGVASNILGMVTTVSEITGLSMELKVLVGEFNPLYSCAYWGKVFEEMEKLVKDYRPTTPLEEGLVDPVTIQPLLIPATGVEAGVNLTRDLYDKLLVNGGLKDWPDWVRGRVRVIPQVHRLLGYGRGV